MVAAVGRAERRTWRFTSVSSRVGGALHASSPAPPGASPAPASIPAGATLYGIHAAPMPVLAGSPFVRSSCPPLVGGAVTLTVPIAYLQDLMVERPGAGASLLAVQRLAGDVIAATCFARWGRRWQATHRCAVPGARPPIGAAALWAAERR